MALSFEEDALPLLLAIASDERDGGFPVLGFLQERGSSRAAAERLLDLLIADGYINATTQKNGAGAYVIVYDAQLTAKALRQLDLWPADDERALYLVRRVVDALDALGSEGDATNPERSGRARAAAGFIRDVAVEVAAALVAKGV
ncbi:MAG: hypothetical protein ABIQ73_18405 [Acidimicrobiales bacterium]